MLGKGARKKVNGVMRKMCRPATSKANAFGAPLVALPLLLGWWCSMTAVACAPGLEPSYRIRSLRVVAMQAEPPEAVSGETVRLRPVLASPDGPVAPDEADLLWWHCAQNPAMGLSDPLVCASELQRQILGRTAVLEDQIPTQLFDGEASEGVDANTQLMRSVFGFWRVVGLTASHAEQMVDAVKRVPIYPATPLADLDPALADLDVRLESDGQLDSNQNPILLSIEALEGGPDGEVVSSWVAGKTYWLRPRYDVESLQAYWAIESNLQDLGLADPTSLQAVPREELLARLRRTRRCEVPVFSWYTTAGILQQETTVDERVLSGLYAGRDEDCPLLQGEARRPEVQFTAPEPPTAEGTVHVWAVMRDGRGGTDAQHGAWTVSAMTSE